MPRDPPRVFLLPDPLGFQYGASRSVRGPRLISNRTEAPYLFAPHCHNQDNGAPMVPVIFDAVRTRYQAQTPSEADLFFAFVPLPTLPDAPRRWCAHVENATAELMQRFPKQLERAFVLSPPMPGLSGVMDCRALGYTRAPELLLTLSADRPELRMSDAPPEAEVLRINRMQIPFMSNIRWSSRFEARGIAKPWARRPPMTPAARPLLMSFVGSVLGNKGEARYEGRSRMVSGCVAAPPTVCEAMLLKPTGDRYLPFPEHAPSEEAISADADATIAHAFGLKRRSIFCLEPPGASPGRKSIVDSLLSGCIPTFLMDDAMGAHFDTFWPFHFGWRRQASVAYRVQSLTSGAASFDSIRAHLERLNATGAVATMQEAIVSAPIYRTGSNPLSSVRAFAVAALPNADMTDSPRRVSMRVCCRRPMPTCSCTGWTTATTATTTPSVCC